MTLRAVTFDYWDTIYAGAAAPERSAIRKAAIRNLFAIFERDVPDEEFAALYSAAGAEAERWWRDEQRGYTTQERIRWLLARVRIERPADCIHIAAAERAVDDALLSHPAPLIAGAGDALARLGSVYTLGIISDTGFASGKAQDRLLAQDQLLSLFKATVYSMDVGHAKPRPEPFAAALRALGTTAAETLHIGDNERTDVRGALAAGMRAIRVDFIRQGGASSAEFVARSFEELTQYLLAQKNSR